MGRFCTQYGNELTEIAEDDTTAFESFDDFEELDEIKDEE